MRKIIFAQVLTTNGTTVFSGLFDENENPVSVETECDDSGVTLTIWRNAPETERRDCGISEEEIERTCSMYDDCNECPLWDYCNEDLERILSEYMCLVSDLHKKKTGKGFAEVFSEMYDIPSYSINKDAGLIQDNQTGEIIKMDNKKQSHIKIVK